MAMPDEKEKKPPVVTQEDELPLEPPLRTPSKGHGFSFGGEIGKTIVISFIVTFVVLMGMSVALKGGFFVNKADFTKNIADMVTATDQAKADLAKAKSDVTTAVQTIPNTVTAQVNTSVAQSTAQWNSQLSTMSDKVTSIVNTNQTNTNKISEFTVDVSVLKADVSTIKPKVTTLETQAQTTSTNLTALSSRISVLETSPKSSGIQVDVSAYGGTLNLAIISDKSQYASFRLVFRPIASNGSPTVIVSDNATSDDMLKYLSVYPPVVVSTNVTLIPQYGYRYANGKWQVSQISFLTPRTTISSVSQNKTLTYSTDLNSYDLLVEPIVSALVGTGGSNW